jgi:hypothetical protein
VVSVLFRWAAGDDEGRRGRCQSLAVQAQAFLVGNLTVSSENESQEADAHTPPLLSSITHSLPKSKIASL